PVCDHLHPIVLSAQAVPAAQAIPCVRSLPLGWHFDGFTARSGLATFWLRSDLGGRHALEVSLGPPCATGGAAEIPSDEHGMNLFERTSTSGPTRTTVWLYPQGQACTTYRFVLPVSDSS